MGCGDGLFFDRLAALDGVTGVEGVEPAAALVSPTNPHRDRIHVVPFDERFQPGQRYGLILMLDVLEHLRDPAGALRHALSLLSPGGRVVATVPAFMALWTRHDDLNEHVTRYTRASFRALASAAGLRIHDARYFFHWTALGKLATRALEAVITREPVPPVVPAPSVNAALLALSRVEERSFRGLRLPFGSSLLVVGGASERRASGRTSSSPP